MAFYSKLQTINDSFRRSFPVARSVVMASETNSSNLGIFCRFVSCNNAYVCILDCPKNKVRRTGAFHSFAPPRVFSWHLFQPKEAETNWLCGVCPPIIIVHHIRQFQSSVSAYGPKLARFQSFGPVSPHTHVRDERRLLETNI